MREGEKSKFAEGTQSGEFPKKPTDVLATRLEQVAFENIDYKKELAAKALAKQKEEESYK